jgi:hypothetical protein
MSDEPKKPGVKRVRWKTWAWISASLLVLYLLSIFPVCLIGAWLVEWRVIPQRYVGNVVVTFYAPLVWAWERFPPVERAVKSVSDALDPLAPPTSRMRR